jgi:hypothetical protein
MKLKHLNLPGKTNITLCLIGEELKSRKFFHILQEIGLEDCYFQPNLDSLILQSMDMDDGADETFSTYNAIMEKRSRKIEAGDESVMKQVMKVYEELLAVRGLRSETKG